MWWNAIFFWPAPSHQVIGGCYYRALQDGPASVVVPIDKLSILVTIAFSRFTLNERLSKKAAAGLVLIVAGTLALLI